jgi:hypothetical protein
VEHFDTPIGTSADVLAATTASVVVVADEVDAGPWEDSRALTLMQRFVRAGSAAMFVFPCPSQTRLMETCYRELKLPADRLVGTAPSAVVGAVRAMAGLELGLAAVDLMVVGRPPAFVVGWSTASVAGSLVSEQVAPHRLVAISRNLGRLWPPTHYAIASATAQIVEGLTAGSRRRHAALTILDGQLGARGSAVMLPLELGRCRILSHTLPSLSPQEQTEMVNGIQ